MGGGGYEVTNQCVSESAVTSKVNFITRERQNLHCYISKM